MMERDPVCGMMVSPARAAAQAVYAGKTYFFAARDALTNFALILRNI